MKTSLEAAVERYGLNEKLLDRLMAGLDEADWRRRPAPEGNPAIWILGHVATYRRAVIRRLGDTLAEAPWEALFRRGTHPDAEGAGYPSAADLRQDLGRTGDTLRRLAAALAPDAAAAVWDWPMKGFTAEQSVCFFHAHESYHLGQLGYVRRLLGKPGIA